MLVVININLFGGGKQMNSDEVLTIDEVAELLKVGRRSIYKLVKVEGFPGKKVLNKWRFLKIEVLKWVANSNED